MELDPFIDLTAGSTYLVVVGAYSAGLRVSNAGKSEPQTSFFLDMADNTWYYTTNTPMVRMNFDPIVSVAEQAELSHAVVMPNPTLANATLRFDLQNNADLSYTVTDVSGKVMQATTINGLAAGSHELAINSESWAAGIYTVVMTSNGTTLTKKFVKR